MKISNWTISLFDPLRDHIEDSATAASSAKSHSPILSMLRISGIPIVTKHLIIAEKEHEKAARRIEPLLKYRAADIIRSRIKDANHRNNIIESISVKTLVIGYKDIWDIEESNVQLYEELSKVFAHKDSVKRIILNLASGTTPARTALYLAVKRLFRGTPTATIGFVKDNSTRKDPKTGNDDLEYVPEDQKAFIGLIAQGVGTRDPSFASDLNRIEKVLLTPQPDKIRKILITGPTGVGKSELAKLIMAYMRSLHGNITEENCIHQNIAALAPSLIESELFGHEPHSFTDAGDERHIGIFERANNGVVFLDEIGELPKHLQVKLLTLLDGVPFSRVGGTEKINSSFLLLSGTNKNLRKACAEGDFRQDLYERLRTWSIDIPRIHNRISDMEIALKTERGRWGKRTRRDIYFSDKEAEKYFWERTKKYGWPGNYREFHATFVHLATFAGEKGISKEDIEKEFKDKITDDELADQTLATIGQQGSVQGENQYDMSEMARLACALDVCRKSKTAEEAGKILFAARADSAQRKGTLFNGTSSLQRLFNHFGLKVSFNHGTFSVHPLKR